MLFFEMDFYLSKIQLKIVIKGEVKLRTDKFINPAEFSVEIQVKSNPKKNPNSTALGFYKEGMCF